MRITLIDAGKRFNRDWIFRHLHYEFLLGHHYSITGPNGSGKSTLLQAIAGSIGISEGSVKFRPAGGAGAEVADEQVFRHISIGAPYLEVIEEMTATELLQFHQSFKPFLPSWSVADIIAKLGLAAAADKQIRYYSSGMRQRIRLAQAIFSDTPVLLLDEPCTNLDMDGIQLYRQLIRDHGDGRTVIVSSNDLQEYDFCEHSLSILDYK